MPRQYSSWARRQVVVRLRSGESVSTSHPHQANNKKSQQAVAGKPRIPAMARTRLCKQLVHHRDDFAR